jgi:uncharacterized membrane protein YqjE
VTSAADAAVPARRGWFATLRELPAQLAAMLVTRGEIAALELADARDRLLRSLALGAIAAVLMLAALLTLSLWVAAIFWDGPRGLALGLLTLAYGGAGVWLLFAVRRDFASAPPLLAQTLAELQKDRDALARRTASPGDSRAS